MPEPVIHPDIRAISLHKSKQPVYDRPFELNLLFQDPGTGAVHYVVRYRPGTKAKPHRHTVAHTIIVLEGFLSVDGDQLGPGGYAHHPGAVTMVHEPTGDEGCLFVLIFHGPFDVAVDGVTEHSRP